MTSITTITDAELTAYLRASEADIVLCCTCLALGITHHQDGFPVLERMLGNYAIMATIEAEQRRRRESN